MALLLIRHYHLTSSHAPCTLSRARVRVAQILHIAHNQLSTFERFPSLPALAELHAASNHIKFAPLAAPLAANAPHLEVRGTWFGLCCFVLFGQRHIVLHFSRPHV